MLDIYRVRPRGPGATDHSPKPSSYELICSFYQIKASIPVIIKKKKPGNSWSACYYKIDVTYTRLIRVFHPVYVSGWSRRDETGLDSARTMGTRRVSMIEQLVGSNKSSEASAIASYAFAGFQNSNESRVKNLVVGNRSSICTKMEKFWTRIIIFWKG